MTAADNLTEAADLARQAAEYASLTTQHTLMGRVFDRALPLPALRDHRTHREWETEKRETV